MAESGFVYCLSNRCMPGVYKIGFTRGSPNFRAKQLSAPTGVPAQFEVEWYVESDEADLLEKEIHTALVKARVSPDREFFKVCPIHAHTLLDGQFFSDWMSPDHLLRIHQSKNSEIVRDC